MGRYIDAEKIEYDKHEKIGLGIDYGINESYTYYTTTKEKIDAMPTADVVEVVRCEDCVWYDKRRQHGNLCEGHNLEKVFQPDFFCADGKRREDV